MFEALLNRKPLGPPLVIAGMRAYDKPRRSDIPEGMVTTAEACRVVGVSGLGTAISRTGFPRQGEVLTGIGGKPLFLYDLELIERVAEVRRELGLSVEKCLVTVMVERKIEPTASRKT